MSNLTSFLNRIILLGLFVILFCCTNHVSFGQLYEVSLEDKIENSNCVFEGKVIHQSPFWNNSHTLIYTSNTIEIYKIFKGVITSSQIDIITPGGVIGEYWHDVDPSLQLTVGDIGIFFGQNSFISNPSSKLSCYEAYAGPQGFIKYNITNNTASSPFKLYTNIPYELYNTIANKTGQAFQEKTTFVFEENKNPSINDKILGITSFSPNPISAGTFTILTIDGNDFTTNIPPAKVEFLNSDDGGATWITVPMNHIILWNNTQIQVYVPNGAGTGPIRITDNFGSTFQSLSNININYNVNNAFSGGVYYPVSLANRNGTGGYNFVYNVNFNSDALRVAAFERAMETWRCNTFVNFNRLGTTATACEGMDFVSVVTMDNACPVPVGVLGVCYRYRQTMCGGDWYLTECDLKFNSLIAWNYGPGATVGLNYDFESVALHELGHGHLLDHTILSPPSVMHYALPNATDRRTLTGISEVDGGNYVITSSQDPICGGVQSMSVLNGVNCPVNSPTANFSVLPLSGCAPLTVAFTDLTTNSPTSWSWDIDNNGTVDYITQNPVHTYSAPGTYTVKLTATNITSNDVEIKNNYITVNPFVTSANITGNDPVCSNQAGLGYSVTNTPGSTYTWTVVGGNIDGGQGTNSISATWGVASGSVCLFETNSTGCISQTVCKSITVQDIPNTSAITGLSAVSANQPGGSYSVVNTSGSTYTWSVIGGVITSGQGTNLITVNWGAAGVGNVSVIETRCMINGPAVNLPVTISAISTPTYIWAKKIGSASTDWGYNITYDASGNVYIAGGFQGTADFDPGAGVTNLTSLGSYDIYFAKYTANGDIIWAKQIGGTLEENAQNILVDNNGNIYISGYFNGTVDFDPGPGIANITSTGAQDIYFAKFDSNGNYLWAKSIGDANTNMNIGLAIGTTGLYIAGYYSGSVDFDPGPGNTSLTCAGGFDAYFAKYDLSNGNFIWAKRFGGGGSDYCYSISLDNNDNCYIAGVYDGTVDFNPGPGFAGLTSLGLGDCYLAKYDVNGNYVWAKSIGSTTGDVAYGVHAYNGYVYITGAITGTTDFDPGLGSANYSPVGGADFFFGKYDSNGNYIWANVIGGASSDYGYSIYVDILGAVNVSGHFQGTVDFNPDPFVTNSYTSTGSFDIFFAKYDANGYYVWTAKVGSINSDLGRNIKVDDFGFIYLTGYFSNTADFDPGAGVANLTSSGGYDIYFAKYCGYGYGCDEPLPIDLVNFKGQCKETAVELVWTTASETNSDYFIVERSVDLTHWTPIAQLFGAGTSNSVNEYVFYDSEKIDGIKYYQLKQTDFDGNYEYYGPITINNNCDEFDYNIILLDQPAHNELLFEIIAQEDKTFTVSIYDIFGQLLFASNRNLSKGLQTMGIDISSFADGIYFLKVSCDDSSLQKKFLKQ